MKQLGLTYRKLDKNGQLRGGARKNAGRKPAIPGCPQMTHAKRPQLDPRHPNHVTLRTLPAVGQLRRLDVYKALRKSVAVLLKHDTFRVVHMSIQRDHIHLIIEADDAAQLTSCMRRFEISAAKQLNRAVSNRLGWRRTGRVFVDRYYAVPVTCPTQARNTLQYVLNNWRKHDHARAATWKLDPFSSAVAFDGWSDTFGAPSDRSYEALLVKEPTTWLLRVGWKRGGGRTISWRGTWDPETQAKPKTKMWRWGDRVAAP